MKQLASIFMVVVGSAILTTLVLLLLAEAGVGLPMDIQSGDMYALLAGIAVICFGSGALLWKGWQIALGEVWVVTGSFLLGAATRSGPAEAELVGVCGLLSFTVGYLVLRRASGRNANAHATNSHDREQALQRMLEDSGSPAEPAERKDGFIFLRGLSVEH